MLFIHPIIQFLAFLLACYVFYLGIKRFQHLHLKQKVIFKWKQHVFWGQIALGTVFVGMLGGVSMVYIHWRSYFITGLHAKIAIILAPLLAFGFLSGRYMNSKKKKRKWLPFIHAINNVVILLLTLVQIATGWRILSTYVLGL